MEDASNTERCPSPPPAYFDQDTGLRAAILKMHRLHEYDIVTLQSQMMTTREAITKMNTQNDAQEKTTREAITKINLHYNAHCIAQEDNSKAISEIQKKLKTKGWKRFLLHLMFFILVNGIIDYVAYYYFSPWFGSNASVNYGVIKDMVNLCIVVYLLLKY